jgi:hypothetical protein
MDPAVVPDSDNPPVRAMSVGRRLYRGVVFALLVGFVGAALSVIPGLFVQSIFIGNAQRCAEQQRLDVIVEGEIVTDCGEQQSDTPTWLPATIIAGGGLFGLLGGFGYGFVSPTSGSGRNDRREPPWLPF